MNVLETSYETILQAVRRWPPTKRFALVRDVINTLSPEAAALRPKRNTLDEALGLLATDQPAPSDEDVQRWLAERRTEKYG
ncbi:MAG TPA: hypothetical protein ENN19_17760 [Chloroflexi bacterium]|nr:hypothetical protein [Chloroflexota bacterium]